MQDGDASYVVYTALLSSIPQQSLAFPFRFRRAARDFFNGRSAGKKSDNAPNAIPDEVKNLDVVALFVLDGKVVDYVMVAITYIGNG